MKKYKYIIYTGILLIVIALTFYVYEIRQPLQPVFVSSNKAVHISFDDVYLTLRDLKDNAEEYQSIFESVFLNDLKELHERYGAKFSLYVYEKAGDFDIKDMPLKFRKEFKEHASWLKFGFHAVRPEFDQNIKLEDFKTSFMKVYNAIYHFADTASLCHVLRLHYFYGNDSIITFINNWGGVKGLLCADDERDSYNLNKEENEILQRKFYLERRIKYFKTDLRYENISWIKKTLEQMCNRDTLVLFTHEWAYMPLTLRQGVAHLVHNRTFPPNWFAKDKLERSVIWLHEHGYKFSFLE